MPWPSLSSGQRWNSATHLTRRLAWWLKSAGVEFRGPDLSRHLHWLVTLENHLFLPSTSLPPVLPYCQKGTAWASSGPLPTSSSPVVARKGFWIESEVFYDLVFPTSYRHSVSPSSVSGDLISNLIMVLANPSQLFRIQFHSPDLWSPCLVEVSLSLSEKKETEAGKRVEAFMYVCFTLCYFNLIFLNKFSLLPHHTEPHMWSDLSPQPAYSKVSTNLCFQQRPL